MKRSLLIIILAALFGIVAAYGCGGGAKKSSGGGGGEEIVSPVGSIAEGGSCTADDECQDGLACQDGLCVKEATAEETAVADESEEAVADTDADDDGITDAIDNCATVANADQSDLDGDGTGDACDGDLDGDGAANNSDALPLDSTETADDDEDGTGNNADEDDDGDGVADVDDVDSDGDGVIDKDDNCAENANADQADLDGDKTGDTCDVDDDGDSIPDSTDNCPVTSNIDQADNDNDGSGDSCDTDDDNDGKPDTEDNCKLNASADQTDTDDDKLGDVCDSDDDGDGADDTEDDFPLDPTESDADKDDDGVLNSSDNCPLTSNIDQADFNNDGKGDACTDDDGDGDLDGVDNCPTMANADQADFDTDKLGDVCDPNDDNDDKTDESDAFPYDPEETTDTDGDKTGDNADDDDDGDDILDEVDGCPNTLTDEEKADTDKDGVQNKCDICVGDDALLLDGGKLCSIGDPAQCGNSGNYQCSDGKVECSATYKDAGTSCNADSNACTVSDICGELGECAAGAQKDCNDSSVCTDDGCNTLSGDCVYVSNSFSESCSVNNEFGTCAGTKTCAGGAFDSCTAKTPAAESCNGIDDDCDGVIDEDLGSTTCGEGVCANTVQNCVDGKAQICDASVTDGKSCSDDDKCNGSEACQSGVCAEGSALNCDDGDACTVDSCLPATGCESNIKDSDGDGIGDCSDNCPQVSNPSQGDNDGDSIGNACDEETCDGVDNNGDGETDEGFDNDSDAVTSCGGDCDDNNASVNPAAQEICDAASVDENCSGEANEGCDCINGETKICGSGTGECGYGQQLCENGKWNDCQGDTKPVAEICDGLDNDCNEVADDTAGIADADQDGLAAICGDCNDNNSDIKPGAAEICDAALTDENCSGEANEGCECINDGTQSCGDDTGACVAGTQTCSNGKWGECLGFTGPAEETCDDIDNDCNGLIDDVGGVLDVDKDGKTFCQGDCNDKDGAIYPGAEEICDGKDNECNNIIDDASDVDGDGYNICQNDCNDSDDTVNPSVDEECDGEDDNCNGQIDEDLADEDDCNYYNCVKKDWQKAAKPLGTVCDDENACTTGDACLAGSCSEGLSLDCDDQNACTADSCDSSLGCQHGNDTTNACGTCGVIDTTDTDSDGLPDVCDDNDGDGVTDNADNCPVVANPDQADLDGDGLGNACDDDPDGDGFVTMGEDEVPVDNCPYVSNLDQLDTDSDAKGDACDNDIDGDNILNEDDAFPYDPAKWADAEGKCGGKVCDTDIDDDDKLNGMDDLPLDPEEWADNDSDGIGNEADTDDDGDGIPDTEDNDQDNDAHPKMGDNCPVEWNFGQADLDEDGAGDVCDNDIDGDGVDLLSNGKDNCPFANNPDQADMDKDGQGDLCDDDDDGDGVGDKEDQCPGDDNELGKECSVADPLSCVVKWQFACVDKKIECVATSKADGAACDILDSACTEDICQGGKCEVGPQKKCGDDNVCTDDSCNPADGACEHADNAALCDDGNACSQTDICEGGACVGGNPVLCTVKDQCHDVGACDLATGMCSTPVKENGVACDDGNACSQTDTCEGGACVGGNPVLCTVKDQCHDVGGTCDPATGACSEPFKPDGTECNAEDDKCKIGKCSSGICENLADVVEEDNNPCTSDGCAPLFGVFHVDNTEPCDDGNSCTENDKCSEGKCANGQPKACDDNDPCTEDFCDPALGCQAGMDTTNVCGTCGVADDSDKDDTPDCNDVCPNNVNFAAALNACGNCDDIDTTDTDGDGTPDVCDEGSLPLAVASTYPEDGSEGLALNSSIQVTFNNELDSATVTSETFYVKNSGGLAVDGSIVVSGKAAVFIPPVAGWESVGNYTATVTTGVKNTGGKALAQDFSWSFKTGTAADTTAPTVASKNPEKDVTDVPINANIYAVFSEMMNGSSISAGTFKISTIKDGAPAFVSGGISYAGLSAIFNPDNNLESNTTYTATVYAGVKDAANVEMGVDDSWEFTTSAVSDLTPPEVTTTAPADGAADVDIDTVVSITFSEAIDLSTVNMTTFFVNKGLDTKVDGKTDCITEAGITTCYFTPKSSLEYDTNYAATVTKAVKDLAGNALAANYTWQFKTEPGWMQVSAGSNHSAGIKTDGTLWTWGKNDKGQLGDGTTEDKLVPTKIGLDKWVFVSATGTHSAGIKEDGTLWAFGSNSLGQLGNKDVETFSSVPVKIITAEGANDKWLTVSASTGFTVAIRDDGTLWGWGGSFEGELGVIIKADEKIMSPIQIGSDSNWKDVTAGTGHVLALKSDGSIWSWGRANEGQLGYPVPDKTVPNPVPTQIGDELAWMDVSAGHLHSLAVKTDGTLWAWGSGSEGQIGAYSNSNVPFLVGSNTEDLEDDSGWIITDAGGIHSLAIKTDGTVWSFGDNNYGQLGVPKIIALIAEATQIGSDKDWLMISGGQYHTAAIRTDGTLWTWGINVSGQLGDGTTVKKNSPVEIK